MTTPRSSGREFCIDALRVAAILRVVLYHVVELGWLTVVFPAMGVMFAIGGSLTARSLTAGGGAVGGRASRSTTAVVVSRFRRLLPVSMGVEARAGYDDEFVWTDFFVGDWKLELIASARAGSFVERFLARRGEGMHHLSIDLEEGGLDAYTAALEAAGLRIVDRGDYGGGDATAFISPRSTPGILVPR